MSQIKLDLTQESYEESGYWFNIATAHVMLRPIILAKIAEKLGKESEEYKRFAAIGQPPQKP